MGGGDEWLLCGHWSGLYLSRTGMVWEMCIRGVSVGLVLVEPLVSGWFDPSLHVIPKCALTFGNLFYE